MITIVKCSIPSQLNNMPRVVVTDFRLHHTSSLIIVWLHSLSGVIRSLLCNPHAFSPAIIIMLAVHILSCSCLRKVCCVFQRLSCLPCTFCFALVSVMCLPRFLRLILRFTAFPIDLSALTCTFLFKVNT